MVEGLITERSNHPAKETADRLARKITGKGATVVARIDHAAAAAKVGLELRPTEVLIFGNPNVGTHLMQQEQLIGLELPAKVLVWEDDKNVTWLTYQDMEWLANRYGIASAVRPTVEKLSSLLRLVVDEAASKDD